MSHGVSSLERAFAVAALVALGALLSVVPHLYYLGAVARVGAPSLPVGALLRAELASAAFVVVVAALTGALFAQRFGLAGLGELGALRTMRGELCAAALVGVATYLLLGRQLAARAPASFPTELGWAVGRFVKGAVFEEVVARFGMLTIACGALRNRVAANLVQAAFFTWLGLRGLESYGLVLAPSPLLVAAATVTFATHYWLGAVYAARGLLAAVVLHAALGCGHLIHPLGLLD